MTPVLRLTDYRRKHRRIFFTRHELNQLLSLYSRQVARGEWRDYAIDQRDTAVVFSVFRHTHENPLYSVLKLAAGNGRAGGFLLLQGRQRLAAGISLGEVLNALNRALGPVRLLLDSEAQR